MHLKKTLKIFLLPLPLLLAATLLKQEQKHSKSDSHAGRDEKLVINYQCRAALLAAQASPGGTP